MKGFLMYGKFMEYICRRMSLKQILFSVNFYQKIFSLFFISILFYDENSSAQILLNPFDENKNFEIENLSSQRLADFFSDPREFLASDYTSILPVTLYQFLRE